MLWRNSLALLLTGTVLLGITAEAKQVVYPEVEDVVKPKIKAKYIEERPEQKTQRSLQPSAVSEPALEHVNAIEQPPVTSLNDQLVLDNSYVNDTSRPRTLTNDYPLKKSSTTPNKLRVKAQYSENGIVSDLGVEKRKVYQYKQANGIMVFSDQQPLDADYQVLLYECFACRPDSTIDWYKIPLFTSHFATDVALAAHRYQLDPALIRAVIHAESAFKPGAVSKAGAKGLMQLMPGTASDMGVDNPLNAQQNIRGGSRYLAQLLAQFNGDLDLACAAYNAGPSTVTQYRGIPPYPETQAYVKRVKILFKRYQKALAS